MLEQLNEIIKTKRSQLVKKTVLSHHDNTLAHTLSIMVAKIHELHNEILPHTVLIRFAPQ